MKSVVILSILLLIMVPLVLAGESIDIDFDSGPTEAVFLYEGDEVRFELLGDTHAVIIEERNAADTMIKIDIVHFLNDGVSEVSPGIVTLDTVTRVDLDRDGTNDVNLALYSIAQDGEIHMVVQKIYEPGEAPITGLIVEDGPKINTSNVLIVLGILVALVILFLVFRNQSSKKTEEKPEEKKPEEKELETKEEPKGEDTEEPAENDSG